MPKEKSDIKSLFHTKTQLTILHVKEKFKVIVENIDKYHQNLGRKFLKEKYNPRKMQELDTPTPCMGEKLNITLNSPKIYLLIAYC